MLNYLGHALSSVYGLLQVQQQAEAEAHFPFNWSRRCLVEPRWIPPLAAVGFRNDKIAGFCRQGTTDEPVTGKAEPDEVLFTRERLRMPLAAFCGCFCSRLGGEAHRPA